MLALEPPRRCPRRLAADGALDELLDVLARRPNLLVLDEPTNDLDLDALQSLEAYLDRDDGAFGGRVVVKTVTLRC